MNRNKQIAMVVAAVVSLGPGGIGQAAMTDQEIESAVKTTYVFVTYLKGDDIRVESKEGVVQLTGTVSDDSHKVLAAATVMNLPGVRQVENQLQAPVPDDPPKSDKWIRSIVRLAYTLHPGLKTVSRIEVDHGVVTLTGRVGDETLKELAGECARGIYGVNDVHNQLMVVPAATPVPGLQKPVDDPSIAAEARVALLLHRDTNALPLSIETSNGVLTIRGSVKSATEKDLIGTLVQDLPGATTVRNLVTAGG